MTSECLLHVIKGQGYTHSNASSWIQKPSFDFKVILTIRWSGLQHKYERMYRLAAADGEECSEACPRYSLLIEEW